MLWFPPQQQWAAASRSNNIYQRNWPCMSHIGWTFLRGSCGFFLVRNRVEVRVNNSIYISKSNLHIANGGWLICLGQELLLRGSTTTASFPYFRFGDWLMWGFIRYVGRGRNAPVLEFRRRGQGSCDLFFNSFHFFLVLPNWLQLRGIHDWGK